MGEKEGAQQQLAANRFKLANNVVQCVDMADVELILRKLRGICQENKEQLEMIKEEIVKVNTRLEEAEHLIEIAEERILNMEEVTAAGGCTAALHHI